MCPLYTLINPEMNSGLLHLEQEEAYSVQLLCMWIILDNEQKNVLVPHCVTKAYNLQLLYINIK
jgi:hypothetical protein